MDATIVPMPGTPTIAGSSRAGLVYAAGWYRRTADDDGHDGTRAAAAAKKGAGKKKDTIIWGMECEIVTLASPKQSSETDYPFLIMGASFHVPSKEPCIEAAKIFELIHQMNPDIEPDYLAADRLYLPNASIKNLQKPLKEAGYKFCMDYPKDRLGIQDEFKGSILVDGTWYCPRMPEPLINATRDAIAKRVDTDTRDRRIEQRAAYALWIKEHEDRNGQIRYSCPAEGNNPTVQCPLKPKKAKPPRAVIPPRADLRPAGPICTLQSTKFTASAGLKYHQDWPYLSPSWRAHYNHPRNTVESQNSRAKNGDEQRLGDPTIRKARSVTAQAVFAATALVCVNLRRCQTWLTDTEVSAPTPVPKPDRRRQPRRTDAPADTTPIDIGASDPTENAPPSH